MCQPNQHHLEITEKLVKYCDYGNPRGLNDLLTEAAELLRNSQPIHQEKPKEYE